MMTFKRSDIPGEDIRRGMEMADKRRQLIEESSDVPVEYEFGVNRLAKALHPGSMKARIADKQLLGVDSCLITMVPVDGDSFPYFRAGQFITLSAKAGDAFLSRPYSIASSPKMALDGHLQIIVQRKGIFSTYLIDELEAGQEIIVSEPSGDFCYDSIRDRKKILAIAGGSGITPFLSMMKAIMEGSEDHEMTLIYGVRTLRHLLFDVEDYKDERIRIVPILSDENDPKYRHGFIDAGLLKDHLDDDTSVFMCGPDAMYKYVETQLDELGFKGPLRKERNSIGDREVPEIKTYRIRVHITDEVYEIDAHNNETIITALERAGIPAPVRCRNGVCGFCHSRVINGDYWLDVNDDHRRAADRKFNYIHPCCSYPESDMEIEIPRFDI